MSELFYYSETPSGDESAAGMVTENKRSIVNSSTEELIVLCIDTSRSMSSTVRHPTNPTNPKYTRSHEVVDHLFRADGLFPRLEVSKNRSGFWTTVILFSGSAKTVFPTSRMVTKERKYLRLMDSTETMTKLFDWGNATSIGSALSIANQSASNWIMDRKGENPDKRYFVTILVISDGGDNDESGTAQREALKITKPKNAEDNPQLATVGDGVLRSQKVIACAAYGDDGEGDANWALLKSIATGPTFYGRVETGEQMRDFLLRSTTIATGRD